MLASRRPAALAAALLSSLLLAGCADQSGPPSLSLTRVSFADVPGWQDDTLSDMLGPMLAECGRLGRLPADLRLGGAGQALAEGGQAAQYRAACTAATRLRADDSAGLHRFFETWFLPYAVADRDDPDATLTGYFEPEIAGSLGPSPAYPVPVYARPKELVTVASPVAGEPPVTGQVRAGKVEPYWSRAQIDRGALRGRNLEILWLRSPIDLFFLQIQGSGRVRLPSGQIVRLG